MWFKQHIKQKTTKPKLQQRLLSFILALVLGLSIAPFQTQAYDENAGSKNPDNENIANTTGGRGVDWRRTGWLIYIADKDGNLCSRVAALAYKETPDAEYADDFLVTRIGEEKPYNWFSNCPWGPVLNGGGSADQRIKKHLRQYLDKTIKHYLGDDVWDMVAADKNRYYFMVETVSWHARPGNHTDSVVATHWGFVKMWEAGQAAPNGKGYYPYNKIAQALYIEKLWPGFEQYNMYPPTTFLSDSSNLCLGLDTLTAYGYGIGAFKISDIGTGGDHQTTCDESRNGTPSKPADESSNSFKIVKTYRTLNTDTSTYSHDGTFWKDNSSHDIEIEDESVYKLVSWKISKTYKTDVHGPTWYSDTPPSTRSGSTPQLVNLNTPETTVYLLLERKEGSKGGTGNFTISQSTITRKIKISDPDFGGIGILKDTSFTWASEAHTTSCSHTDKKTTYPHGDNDSNCSNQVEKKDGDGNTVYKADGKTPATECGGHEDSTTIHCTWGEWSDTGVTVSLKNSSYSSYPSILVPSSAWNKVTNTDANATTKYSQSYTRSSTAADSFAKKGFDYACVIMRGSDKLTVAQWKNDASHYNTGANEALSDVGFSSANTPQGFRKTSTYYEDFTATFINDSDDVTTTYKTTAGAKEGINCGANSKDYSLSSGKNIAVNVQVDTYSGSAGLNGLNSHAVPGQTSYGTFAGIPSLTGSNRNVLGVEVERAAPLEFLPYIQMNYDVFTATHQKNGSATQSGHGTAYVLGQYQRQIMLNDYAEISWEQRKWDNPNLTLSSLQWSTHASASQFISEGSFTNEDRTKTYTGLGAGTTGLQKYRALPGGATLAIQVRVEKNGSSYTVDDRQYVSATTYQFIIEGTGKEQMDNTQMDYTGYTEADAKAAHEAYVLSVIQGIEGIGFNEYVAQLNSSNLNTLKNNLGKDSGNVWNLNGNGIMTAGASLSPTGNSGTASTEDKYYLKDTDTLRVPKDASGKYKTKDTIKKYTFYTNTLGEIFMLEDDPNANLKGERIGTLIDVYNLTGVAKQINDRTHIVTNLYEAVERQTGFDNSGRSKTGNNWYNEAFDGITCIVINSDIPVGLSDADATGQIETVEDPKLTQPQKSQSDMFNPEKYNVAQYRTKDTSTTYGIPGLLGKFKGVDVYAKDLNLLFFSRQWLIPNITVQDLN